MTYSDEMRAEDMATISEQRAQARDQQDGRRFAEIVLVGEMKEKGYSNAAIAHELCLSESTVRKILELEDDCFDEHGQPYPRGRCDTCGAPCDDVEGLCTADPSHTTAIDISETQEGAA